MARDIIRRVTLRPYRKGMGPSFTLTMWDTGRIDWAGSVRTVVGYKLTMREHGKTTALFEGEDYKPSPLEAIDSDDSVNGLLGFLTLRKGDTDDDWFKDYTPEQLDYCDQHAESLSLAALDRFGEL
jgi:hypothetical protein